MCPPIHHVQFVVGFRLQPRSTQTSRGLISGSAQARIYIIGLIINWPGREGLVRPVFGYWAAFWPNFQLSSLTSWAYTMFKRIDQ